MSTAETVKAQLQADIAAANAATGKKDTTMHDAVASLIEGFGGSGGEAVYFSGMGQLYTPHMVIPGSMRYVRDHFENAVNLVTFIQANGNPELDSDYGIFSGCTSLEEVWVARGTFGQYFFRICPALKKITLGRVGLPVTKLHRLYDIHSMNIKEITCYVASETLAGITTSVSSNIVPAASPDATIIYRNSTTGEVITE